jgi:hypothetical protein
VSRPTLDSRAPLDDAAAGVGHFVADLQRGLGERGADAADASFAADGLGRRPIDLGHIGGR